MRPQGHRDAPLHDAIDAAEREIRRLRLRADLQTYGSVDLPVYACTLRDSNGRVRSRSAGKGRGDQSRASALFEAIEHYYSSSDVNAIAESGDWSLSSPAAIAEQPALGECALIQRLAAAHPDVLMAVSEHQSLDGREVVSWPVFLHDPGYHLQPLPGDELPAYASFFRYTSSSGLAAGTSTDEALLHALLEVVERDAVSLALIKWFCLPEAAPAMAVTEKSMPAELRTLMDVVRREVGCEPLLLDVTTDIGIPTFIGLTLPRALGMSEVSAGSSLDVGYAAERAVTELLQGIRLTQAAGTAGGSPARPVSPLERYPRLKAAAACDSSQLQLSRVPLRSSPAVPTVEANLSEVAARLRAAGLSAYWRTLSQADADTPVVSVVVPGAEHFSTVQGGFPVLCTGRGARLLSSGWSRQCA